MKNSYTWLTSSLDPIAVYGAVVGSISIVIAGAALGWQVYTWRHERGIHVEVRLSLGALVSDAGGVEKALILTAINRGSQSVRVTSTGLLLQDGSNTVMTQVTQLPSAGLPGNIAQGDSAMMWFDLEEVMRAGIDLHKPVTGQVVLATGEVCRSAARPVFSDRR